MKLKHVIVLFALISLCSCNDIKTEDDKYPDIPEFPKFKNGGLKLVLNGEILTKIDSNVVYEDGYTTSVRYLVNDSTLYFISYLADIDRSEMPEPGVPYSIHLYTFKGEEITRRHWIDNDFKINFDIDRSNNDLIIGKRRFYSNSKYLRYDTLPKFIDSTRVDSVFYDGFGFDPVLGVDIYKPKPFEIIVIDSEAVSNAAENSAISIFTWRYRPIYLSYYKVRHKNKVGLTKVTGLRRPTFVKCKGDLYFIDKDYVTNKDCTKTEKVLIYKVE